MYLYANQSVRTLILLLSFCFLSAHAATTSLLQVYQDAFNNDPTFKAAQATWRATREAIPIARAALLPQLQFSALIHRERIDATLSETFSNTVGSLNIITYGTPHSYSLSIEQPVFNFTAWQALHEAHLSVKSAYATCLAATQDLMLRVIQAYFALLQANDDLNFINTEKKATARQLDKTRHRYQVGLVAITAVYEAQAHYDEIVAEAIATHNNVANTLERLREITGHYYTSITGIRPNIPLIHPDPRNIEQWSNMAEQHNYQLLAARYYTLAAKQHIKLQQAARAPIVSALGNLHVSKGREADVTGTQNAFVATVGLTLALPIYQGGIVTAKTRQASFEYQKASDELEGLHRHIISLTHQSYLGVLAGISKIKADQHVIRSTQSALKANEAGYQVGTQTVIDVLDSQTDLHRARKTHATDVYNYLINLSRLKQAAGTLSATDLQQLNSWLTIPITLPHTAY